MTLNGPHLDHAQLTRGGLLRAGAAGAFAVAVLPAGARAALPTPTPVDDDIGFLQFAVLTERTALVCYRDCLMMKGVWTADERRQLQGAVKQKLLHEQRITAALTTDAPLPDDYDIELPRSAFRTRGGALSLAQSLERLLVGVYVNAAAFSADGATRLFVARLLSADARQLAAVSVLAGGPAAAGLPEPIDLEAAGAQLDRYLTVNGYPTS